MHEGGFLEQRRASPTSLMIVIALHAAAVTALMLSKTEFVRNVIKPMEVIHIPDTPPPPPEPQQPNVEPKTPRQSQVDLVKPIIPVDRPVQPTFEKQPDIQPAFDSGPIGEAVRDPAPVVIPEPRAEPRPEPKPEPVRREAQMLGSALQPPYPASEERAEVEGSVTVRVRIGADGRVKSVEKVRGENAAFFKATEQQALRHWRFKPATVDGQPVESVKVLTVHFRLDA
jgi:protein TonB